MIAGFVGMISVTDFGLTGLMTLISFGIVSVPFYRGMRLCVRAHAATRRIPRSQLQRAVTSENGERAEALSVLMVRVLSKSLRESDENPTEFVLDATKQYVMNEYDVHYSRPISMYANLLPPLGLLGTSIGMLMLLLSMHYANESLELAALALTLTKTIFALISFAVLESLKIHLHGRLLACLEDAISLHRAGEGERRRTPLAARAAPAVG
jgi:biopolymer transport protein ExbB/TolQ